MNIRENVPLSEYTTMHIGGRARFFAEVGLINNTADEVADAIGFASNKELPFLILGGGSNVLISDQGFDGVVIHPKLLGFEIKEENVIIGASENWDECVRRMVDAGLWGAENLSFIPGTAAGLVVQNGGAYGQDASQIVEDVYVLDIKHDVTYWLDHSSACEFGYRRSIFNSTRRGEFVILSIRFKLSKSGKPNTSYGLKPGTLQEMRDQVIAVRKSKGQDPSEFWSAGSFFKNPIITEEQYAKLPIGTPWYPGEGGMKVPAGYLLDKICNLKGLRVGDAQLSERQVINIINLGKATAHEVLALFKKVRDIVFEQTGIVLVNEPELVGFSEAELEKYLKIG